MRSDLLRGGALAGVAAILTLVAPGDWGWKLAVLGATAATGGALTIPRSWSASAAAAVAVGGVGLATKLPLSPWTLAAGAALALAPLAASTARPRPGALVLLAVLLAPLAFGAWARGAADALAPLTLAAWAAVLLALAAIPAALRASREVSA